MPLVGYQFMLSITRTDTVRNDIILDTWNRRNLADLLIECQLQTLGHGLRKEDSSIKKCTLYTTNRGKIPEEDLDIHMLN